MSSLVTYFDAFGAVKENSSGLVAKRLQEEGRAGEATFVELPTSYRRAALQIAELLRDLKPTSLLMLGFTARTDRARLEGVARNAVRSTAPDNDGEVLHGLIAPGGVAELISTADVGAIAAALLAANLPFSYSVDAGGYVCNATYYKALSEIEERGLRVPCLFVHVPAPEGLSSPESDAVHACALIHRALAGLT